MYTIKNIFKSKIYNCLHQHFSTGSLFSFPWICAAMCPLPDVLQEGIFTQFPVCQTQYEHVPQLHVEFQWNTAVMCSRGTPFPSSPARVCPPSTSHVIEPKHLLHYLTLVLAGFQTEARINEMHIRYDGN